MHRAWLLLLPLAISLSACQPDKDPAMDTITTESTSPASSGKLTNAEKRALIGPPPPECDMLSKEEIQATLATEVHFPRPGQRSNGSYYSCQFDVENVKWSGQVIVEYPRERRKRQTIIDELAGITPENRGEVNGNPARFMKKNTVIVVGGSRPYRIRFTTYPKKSTEPVYSPEEARRLLIELAEQAVN